MQEHWTLGVLLGLPVSVLALLTSIGVAIAGMRIARRGRSRGRAIARVAAVGMLATVLVTAVAFWPWRADHHRWQHIGGTVGLIGPEQTDDDELRDHLFVVQFRETGQLRSCADRRCARVQRGDHLDLSCIRKHHWNLFGIGIVHPRSTWDCRYVRSSA